MLLQLTDGVISINERVGVPEDAVREYITQREAMPIRFDRSFNIHDGFVRDEDGGEEHVHHDQSESSHDERVDSPGSTHTRYEWGEMTRAENAHPAGRFPSAKRKEATATEKKFSNRSHCIVEKKRTEKADIDVFQHRVDVADALETKRRVAAELAVRTDTQLHNNKRAHSDWVKMMKMMYLRSPGQPAFYLESGLVGTNQFPSANC